MRIFIACIIVIGLITFYFIGWNLNKKQKLPKDFVGNKKSCSACGVSGCGSNPKKRSEDNE